MKHLPTDAKERKEIPLWSGLFKYFPDALCAVAHLSHVGNKQHNPGEPLHWDKTKSTDQEDTIIRHLLESGSIDTDGVRHSTKVAWRALALLQLEIEADAKAPTNSSNHLDYEPGSIIPYDRNESTNPQTFLDRERSILKQCNDLIDAGYEPNIEYQFDTQNTRIGLRRRDESGDWGYCFVVRGKVQRKSDCVGTALQLKVIDRSPSNDPTGYTSSADNSYGEINGNHY